MAAQTLKQIIMGAAVQAQVGMALIKLQIWNGNSWGHVSHIWWCKKINSLKHYKKFEKWEECNAQQYQSFQKN